MSFKGGLTGVEAGPQVVKWRGDEPLRGEGGGGGGGRYLKGNCRMRQECWRNIIQPLENNKPISVFYQTDPVGRISVCCFLYEIDIEKVGQRWGQESR